MATDYDKAKVTDREKTAAKHQNALAKYNAKSIANQLDQQISEYDTADKQNAALRDLQLMEASRKGEADRFEAQRQLQNAALGLFASASPAMYGSTTGNIMSMLRNRNDADNSTYWQQLYENQNAIRNAYNESAAQNRIARLDAATNAAKAISDTRGDLAANLNNINPKLYQNPGGDDGLDDIAARVKRIQSGYIDEPYQPFQSQYIMPANAEQDVRGKRNKLRGGDYFDTLVNRFNRVETPTAQDRARQNAATTRANQNATASMNNRARADMLNGYYQQLLENRAVQDRNTTLSNQARAKALNRR